MVEKMANALKLDVDKERFLRLVSNFFQSPQEAITELIQNAYRSNAKEISFLYDPTWNRLVVKDDGDGATDPSVLFTAAKSGWGEGVVNPAGFGLFAMMGLATHTIIESHPRNGRSWKATVNAEAWNGGDIVVEEIERNGNEVGMTFTFTLKPKVNLGVRRLYDVEPLRHYYPIVVKWKNENDGGVFARDLEGVSENGEYVSYPPQLPKVSLKTPAGTLYYNGSRAFGTPGVRVIWEHRLLTNTDMSSHIMEYLKEMDPVLAEFFNRNAYIFVADESKGLSPKLPDRREAIVDDAYHSTAFAVAGALWEVYRDSRIREQIRNLDLPNVVDEYTKFHCDYDPILGALSNNDLFKIAGFEEFPGAPTYWYLANYFADGIMLEHENGVKKYVPNVLPYKVELDPVAMSIANVYAKGDGEKTAKVVAENLVFKPNRYGAAWCTSLKLISDDGVELATMNRLIASPNDEVVFYDDKGNRYEIGDGECLFLVVAPTVEEAMERVRQEDLAGWVVASSRDYYGDLDVQFLRPNTEDELNDQALYREMNQVFMSLYVGEEVVRKEMIRGFQETALDQLKGSLMYVRHATATAMKALELDPELEWAKELVELSDQIRSLFENTN